MRYKVPISVIMPCYGNSLFISKAIESIMDQSFKEFELIIISDGFDDDIEFEIKKFNDSRIVHLKNSKNKGRDSAKNKGVSVALGKYICMMDSDTIAVLYRLELQYNYLEAHLHVGCITGFFQIINDKRMSLESFIKPISYADLKVSLLKDCFVNQSTMMIRSHLLKKYQLCFNVDKECKYVSDYDFFVKTSNLLCVRKLDQILVIYRNDPQQTSSEKQYYYDKIKDEIRKKQIEQFNIELTDSEINLHLKLIKQEYLSDENLELCEDWLNKLLEANDELKIFNNNALYKFLEYSLNIALKNNSLGVWSIEKNLLAFIDNIIPKGADILEFGSGVGTEALLEKYKVTSIEHDESYCFKRGENHNIVHAKIENKWYDKRKIIKALKKEYDLLIIDGPPGKLRAGILQNIHLFNFVKCPIIFDDVHRPLDKEVMIRYCQKLDYEYKIIRGKNKEFAICTKIISSIKSNVSNNESPQFNNLKKLSSAILLLTNKTNKEIFQKYKLLNEVEKNHKVYILLHYNPTDENENCLNNTRLFTFEDNVLKNLGYTPIGDKLLPGNNHFPLLKFYKENPKYDFYWCIEDDVFYNGDWSEFFDFFQKNESSDFISSHINDFEQDPNWYWWNTLEHPDKVILNNQKTKSFNPIYRISTRALSFLDKQLTDGWKGHHEVLIPTLLKQEGLIIQDFGGLGRYVPDDCKNKFYFKGEVDKLSRLNIDSMRYRPIIKSEEINEKLLYHPVKYIDMNKCCIIAAVGASSLHQEWIKENADFFDLHLIVYDDSYELFKLDTPYITSSKGYKFNLIYDYLNNNSQIINQYDFFYMPDDDISIDYNNIKKLFKYMQEYELAVAQPAIANSFYSYPHTTKRTNSIIRYTNFVEVMQPCFSRDALEKVLFTFSETKSGWGIDFHWGIILNYTKRNMAIIDDVFSGHTRPVQSNHQKELEEYMKKYNLSYNIYCT